MLAAEELENIRKVFALYVVFPKSRWEEIKKAETDQKTYDKLMIEYNKKELYNRDRRAVAAEIFVNDAEAMVM